MRYFTCPVEITLSLISAKYKAVILFYLFGGKKRFNELKHLMPSVTRRTLTLLGLSLKPIIEAMRIWSVDYRGKNE
ncbi:winged helix-turn-helix transcriptional regulator [Campylobacter sp. MIT 97-5078]|uniref:winged helix-turn-helix transcriptional regulator n=1 Tax=Campylobacter sp. MIT 97-5078 TaxID=1548153 RepID=UPI000513DD49|nr:helix-turn-helix domain-containing protein [Campylobacter sp. MIT 97-5078]KGI56529.1 hypothetical protein LR59_06795 [Campylobacter sp. MIT 97-5078]TQR27021.1 transcriptional regulator [Campylobacter sp. MIT 97-5078]